jgi:hypothetical protein
MLDVDLKDEDEMGSFAGTALVFVLGVMAVAWVALPIALSIMPWVDSYNHSIPGALTYNALTWLGWGLFSLIGFGAYEDLKNK